jgi:DNA-binding transcriptional LysR family regulator
MMIDNKIKTLITLAANKSYTKTAELLALTQPAISTHIRLLEEEYKIKIFVKDGSSIKLTSEGEILLKYAKKLQAIEEEILPEIIDSQNKIFNIRVGMTPNCEESIIPFLLAEFAKHNFSYHFTLHTYPMTQLYTKLRTKEIDIGIIDGKNSDMRYRPITLDTDQLCLVVASNHPLANKELVRIEEIKKEKLILRPINIRSRYQFETFLANSNLTIKDMNLILEIDNVEIIKQLVASSYGVSILNKNALASEISDQKVKAIPIVGFDVAREINFIYDREYDYQDLILDLIQSYTKIVKPSVKV